MVQNLQIQQNAVQQNAYAGSESINNQAEDSQELQGKTLLVLGGGVQQLPVLIKAREMGVRTILMDCYSTCQGRKYADKFLQVSTTDVPAVLRILRDKGVPRETGILSDQETLRDRGILRDKGALNDKGIIKDERTVKDRKIDGVIAFATDPAAETAAKVAQELGLPGNPVEAAEIIGRKDRLLDFLSRNGFAVPAYQVLTENIDGLGPNLFLPFPVILKPVDSSGSRGARPVYKEVDLLDAYKGARFYSRTCTVLAEHYLQVGYDHIIGGDILVQNGKIVLNGLMDCYREAEHALVPCGKTWPMEMDPGIQKAVLDVLQRVIDLLQIRTAEMNVELILARDGKIYLIDMGLRAGGNGIPTLLSDITGIDLVKWNILAALGEESALPDYGMKGCGSSGYNAPERTIAGENDWNDRFPAKENDKNERSLTRENNTNERTLARGKDSNERILAWDSEVNEVGEWDEDAGTQFLPRQGCFMTYNLHAEEDGFYAGYETDPMIRQRIYRAVIFKKPGDPVRTFVNASFVIGIIWLHFPDRRTMEPAARVMRDLIRIRYYTIQEEKNPDRIIAALWHLGKYLSPREDERAYEDQIVRSAATFLAVSGSGDTVGILCVYLNDPMKNTAYVTALSVSKEYRRCRIAEHLCEKAEYAAAMQGFRCIEGEIRKDNSPCLLLAAALGYEKVRETGRGTVIVRKVLSGKENRAKIEANRTDIKEQSAKAINRKVPNDNTMDYKVGGEPENGLLNEKECGGEENENE